MIIGFDPHKMSHTANAVDPATNSTAASLRIDASLVGYRELMRWAKQFPDRRWAVENARWLGRHLAQWLVARGEVVLDRSVRRDGTCAGVVAGQPPQDRRHRRRCCCERGSAPRRRHRRDR